MKEIVIHKTFIWAPMMLLLLVFFWVFWYQTVTCEKSHYYCVMNSERVSVCNFYWDLENLVNWAENDVTRGHA